MVSSSLSELKSLMASIGVSSTASGKSDEEVSQATDAFLKTVFSQSADSRTSITLGSDTTTSGISASAGTSKLVQSASSLLKASGIDASNENLQSFMQLLQKNMTASMEDKGNLVDHSV